jgi:hypothetical protein
LRRLPFGAMCYYAEHMATGSRGFIDPPIKQAPLKDELQPFLARLACVRETNISRLVAHDEQGQTEDMPLLRDTSSISLRA